MKAIRVSDIHIAPNRQRKELQADAVVELANSIAANGLLHPIVVRKRAEGGFSLVAGERRLRAIDYLSGMGQSFRYSDKTFLEGNVPANDLGELSDIDAFEAELEENIRRQDLTWQEKSQATAQLYELRRLQAEKKGTPPPTLRSLAEEVYPDHVGEGGEHAVRREIAAAKHLTDPDVAKAGSLKEATKIIKRKVEAEQSAALGASVGRTFTAAVHTLEQADAIAWMGQSDPNQFDVILTDPPYGIDAGDFGDAGGKTGSGLGHLYDDSYPAWQKLMVEFARLSWTNTKPAAHLYCFCDITRFEELKAICAAAGWRVFRTPFIWHNPSSQRAPWPTQGPHRRYQTLLYAIKGDRNVLTLRPDVLSYPSDQNLGWAAQKPVALLSDLLQRSCRPGDSVLDPFCGSGSIFPAAHLLKIRAAGIERDPIAYGIAVARLKELK